MADGAGNGGSTTKTAHLWPVDPLCQGARGPARLTKKQLAWRNLPYGTRHVRWLRLCEVSKPGTRGARRAQRLKTRTGLTSSSPTNCPTSGVEVPRTRASTPLVCSLNSGAIRARFRLTRASWP